MKKVLWVLAALGLLHGAAQAVPSYGQTCSQCHLVTASAGPNQTVNADATVTLNGSGSTAPPGAGATISSYAWSQTAGTPEVTLDNGNSAKATFTAPSVAASTAFTFTLTVTDARGFTGTSSCIVTVNPGIPTNLPPVADAGPTQTVNAGVTVTLNGSNSHDPDGTITAYLWEQTGGPAVTLSSTAAVSPTFTAPSVTTATALTFSLTVTDNGGLQASATTIVNVNPAASPAISITAPDGATWSAGGTYFIAWSYTGNPGPVRIDLLKGGSKISTIKASTPVGSKGTGSHSWTIPQHEAGGSNYQISVSSTVVSSCTVTSSTFTIASPAISTTAPNGATWSAGGTYSIAWSYTGNPGPVRIDLLKGGSKISTIKASTPVGSNGTGSYSWTIPKIVASGTDYQIKVSSTTMGSCTTTSSNFAITGSAIMVTSPSGGSWNAGGKYAITWSYTGSPGAVRIVLLNGGAKVSTITASTAVGLNGTGSYSWTIPKTEVTGNNYRVKITSTLNGLINGTSSTFTITGIAAVAGPDQKVSGLAQVKLSGSNSADVTREGVSFLWTQLDGPQVTIADPSSVETAFVAPEGRSQGQSLRFQLTVTGTDGTESQDDCIVNVVQDNAPPIADAGMTQTVAGFQIVDLDGSKSSAPDRGTLFYSWREISGVPVILSDPSAAQPTFISPDVDATGESLVFELTVTDQAGLRSRDTCVVNVVSEILPPKANAGLNQTVSHWTKVVLDGSGSTDEDGEIASCTWRQIGGPPVTLSDPTAIKPVFVVPEINTPSEDLVFELTVTDSAGLQDKAKVTVTVVNEAAVK